MMMYVPNPQSLVYSELQFISKVGGCQDAQISMDVILDDVSREIFAQFVGLSEMVGMVNYTEVQAEMFN